MRILIWVLRVTVALDCLGIAATERAVGTPIFSLLWNQPETGGFGWSEESAAAAERAVAWTMLCVAPLVLVRRAWPLLPLVAIWQLALALAAAWMEDAPFAEWSLFTRAVRIFAPLALMALEVPSARPEQAERIRKWAVWLLRGAAATTFVAHGWQAIALHPWFVDYLIAAGQLFGLELSQRAAEVTLRVIGVVDMVVALLLVTRRWRSVAFYMAAWGALTALVRMVHSGPDAYYDVLVRASNCGVPLAIACYWHWSTMPREHPPTGNS
jgi:hypothetical protein